MSEEILINVTPQETRVAVIENGVLQGEAEKSRMHLTCIRAADAAQEVPISRKHMDVRERSPATEGRAGVQRSRIVAPGMAGTVGAWRSQ